MNPEQQRFSEPLTVADTLHIPWDDVLRMVIDQGLRPGRHPGAQGSSVEGIADDVRCRVAGAVAHDVAERERRNETIHQQLESILRGRLKERLRQAHGPIARDPERRKEVIAELCKLVADSTYGELTGWLRTHLGESIGEDLATVLRDRLDEALHVSPLRDQLAAVGHNGHRGDLLLVLREHLVARLRAHLAENAGPAIVDALDPNMKEALRARLAHIFGDPRVDCRVEELAKGDADLFAAAMAAMAANRGRDALDGPLQHAVEQYLDGMFSGRAEVFRDEIGKLLAMAPAQPSPGAMSPRPQPLAGGQDLAEVVRMAECNIAALIRDRIDEVTRDRMAALLRTRIHDALQLAVSSSQIGIDLGLRSQDLDRISDAIWERWGYVFRERLGRAIAERVSAFVGGSVAESVRAALSPSVLELAAMASAPAPAARSASAGAAKPAAVLAVF